ncbi:MAG: carbohydrate ABC transporter permease [Candidatus Omnitrophica bacterium]|nr:carbohydrate ABC transporter permease [Candidatus Omnitrophota bacterium]
MRIAAVSWRLALVLILLLTFYPFVFMVVTSFKDTHQFYHSFWLPTLPPHFENYTWAATDLARYLLNSLFITATSIAGVLVSSSVAGFIFARYDFPGRQLLYHAIIAMMMIPGVLMLVPAFVWVQRLALIDTYWVLILPYIAGGQVLGIYLMRGFFSEIDNDLFEAAQVDGSGLFGQLLHVAIPLGLPIIGVVAIVSALGVWNNFLWPLVTTSSEEVMVLTVGILRYNTRVGGQYGRMFAGYTISAIPLAILFAFTTRVFLKGITSGALKG